MTRRLRQEPFRAMGTLCLAAVSAAPSDDRQAERALEAARHEVAACERALSRFDPDSDLSRLNRAEGAWVDVDVRLVEALEAALRARGETNGRFDPTILPVLAAAGYDRSFELVGNEAPRRIDGWRAGACVDVAPTSGRARLERGAAVDLGGIGKGFASTRAIEAMRVAWPRLTGALVDLGGDISIWGTPPEGGPWRVDIADPREPDGLAGTLELTGGGVATSGRDTRRFGPDRRLHHLIDPRTGSPAADGALTVTVIAPSAADAEAFATALAVSDLDEARALLEAWPWLSALLIPELGEPIEIGRLPLARKRPQAQFAITIQGGRFQ